MRYHLLACCSIAAAATMTCVPASAKADTRIQVQLPAQPLPASLRDIGRLFGRNVSVDDASVRDLMAPAVNGKLTFEEAIASVLAGTGLKSSRSGGGVVVSKRAESDGEEGGIVVTGSRIRGAPVASVQLTYGREEMRNAGQSSAADVIRAIPQNFSGGQNPGVGANVTGGKSVDMGGGASINLRGLGSDATLTLLNGRRLSFDAAIQSVDVSAIPFGAIERMDVVPDGSSALFGSDAVAGVANIILRRNFDGLETTARIGSSTDGGNFQQQYGATLGQVWSSGSAMVSAEYGSNTGIWSSQRSYLENRSPGLEVYPALRHHNAAVTARQELAPGLTLDIDGIYNKRRREQTMPLNFAGDLSVSRYDLFQKTESWAVAPSLKLVLPADWEVTLAGSYGWNRVYYEGTFTYGTAATNAGYGTYRNVTGNIELSGNGKLVDLPAGPMKIALGGGFRQDRFRRQTFRGLSEYVDRSRDSYYAFGEVSIPVIAPDQKSGLGRSLNLSLAARYEHYSQVGSVTTPKLGLIYAPISDLTLKASWGKSFRAPTFYEQYMPMPGYLYNAATFGGTSGTVMYVVGGNPDLKPERSTNWSATLELHPAALDGAELEVSYFNIRYRDRIVTPMAYPRQALTNPAYADYVTLNPDQATQNSVIDRMVTFTNLSSGVYDPANVVALIDNSNINAGRQNIYGIDVLGRYGFDLAEGRLSAAINGSYLHGEQQLQPGQAFTQLAGALFNPPHFRGRGELGWAKGGVTLTAAVNYIGSVQDERTGTPVKVASMVPVDFTIRYRTDQERGLLAGTDVIFLLQNLFNDQPDTIATNNYTDTPYDSTNYSPFGRVVSLSVTKKW
ncbi:TonB-dependent receptor [Novosphingobium lindaniclasticum]|uniref:TonB-dependent receptor n=1 Tax=Novosphingobium lindaniclasticum TaxID=1329895 RepID=UPI0004CF1492|nr:TonB-dependent receptor [Novosphingobium lindaniclasticum]